VPQRGTSACTYISGVAALRCIFRGKCASAAVWADSIMRGVQAFHNARVSGIPPAQMQAPPHTSISTWPGICITFRTSPDLHCKAALASTPTFCFPPLPLPANHPLLCRRQTCAWRGMPISRTRCRGCPLVVAAPLHDHIPECLIHACLRTNLNPSNASPLLQDQYPPCSCQFQPDQRLHHPPPPHRYILPVIGMPAEPDVVCIHETIVVLVCGDGYTEAEFVRVVGPTTCVVQVADSTMICVASLSAWLVVLALIICLASRHCTDYFLG